MLIPGSRECNSAWPTRPLEVPLAPELQMSVKASFGTPQGISQMCVQLADCSPRRPLTWNVSWVWDNLQGCLLSQPSEGQLCYPAHFHEADSEWQSHLWGTLSAWSGLLLHVEASVCSSRSANSPVTRMATLQWKSGVRRRSHWVHRWRFFSSRGERMKRSPASRFEPQVALKVVTGLMSWYPTPKPFGEVECTKFRVSPWLLFTPLWESLTTLRPSRDNKTLSWNPDWQNYFGLPHLFLFYSRKTHHASARGAAVHNDYINQLMPCYWAINSTDCL